MNPFKKSAQASAPVDPERTATTEAIAAMFRDAQATRRALRTADERAADARAAADKTAATTAADARTADERASAAEAAAEADRRALEQAETERLAAAQRAVDADIEAGRNADASAQALVKERAATAQRGETALQIQAAALRRNADRLRQAADAAAAARAAAAQQSGLAHLAMRNHEFDVEQSRAQLAWLAAMAAWRKACAAGAQVPAPARPILHLRSVRPLSELWAKVDDAGLPPEAERRLLALFDDPRAELPSAT